MNEYEQRAEEQDIFALECILNERGLQWTLEAITEHCENLTKEPETQHEYERYVPKLIQFRHEMFGWWDDPVVWTMKDRHGSKIEVEGA